MRAQVIYVNRGEFAQFETRVADLVSKHGSASIKVSFEYGNGDTRLTRIHYEAIAPNGDKIGKSFNNSY